MRTARMLNVIKHPIKEISVQTAKRKYLKANHCCAITGIKKELLNGHKVQVHHIIPCHVDISKACDPDNLITLTRECHFTAGHCFSWRKYNGSIKSTVGALKRANKKNKAEKG